MSECKAEVAVDFSATGAITFRVIIADCDNSSGQFRYDYQVKKPTGVEHITDRNAVWTNEQASQFSVDDDLNLPEDYELLDVEVDDGSIKCTCHSQLRRN